MAEEIKKIKIKDLPQTTSISDEDAFIESSSFETYKVTADDIARYVSENEHLTEKYIPNDSVGAAGGIAPLDENAKINGGCITYGITANTAYEGLSGKILEQNLDSHLLDTKMHVPANGTSNDGKYLKSTGTEGVYTWEDLTMEDITNALGYIPGSGTNNESDSDTKNTAGATDISDKIYLIGAASQEENPQTYSHDTAYVGTDGCLYSNSTRVLSELISAEEPESQITGDYWLTEY